MNDHGTTVIMFAKPPEPGKVKSRLAAEIGPQQAAEVYRYCLANNLELLRQCECDYQVWITEASEDPIFEKQQLYLQQGDDLGQRMYHAMNRVLTDQQLSQPRNVILIGSDCIELTPGIIQRVRDKLHRHELVLIPALDGGYVLIAASQHIDARLFESIDWSSDLVLRQTVDKAMNLGINTNVLNHLRDIDHAEDLLHYDALTGYLNPS